MAPAPAQARPFYNRVYRVMAHAMYCLWLKLRNQYNCPYRLLPFHWIPVIIYGLDRVTQLAKHGEINNWWPSVAILLLAAFASNMSFRGKRRGRICILLDLKELSSDERDAKIDELWIAYGWQPLEPECADDDLPVAEKNKQPLLVDIHVDV